MIVGARDLGGVCQSGFHPSPARSRRKLHVLRGVTSRCEVERERHSCLFIRSGSHLAMASPSAAELPYTTNLTDRDAAVLKRASISRSTAESPHSSASMRVEPFPWAWPRHFAPLMKTCTGHRCEAVS